MSNKAHVSEPLYGLLHTDVEGFDSLAELALDMRSSWTHATDQVWRQLDPDLWELTQNPWVVLQTVSREKLQGGLVDPAFRKNIDDLVQARRDAAQAPAWFQQAHPQSPLTCVAYFSMEFMLSEALPFTRADSATRPATDYTARVIPHRDGVGVPLEEAHILWQR